MCPAEQAFDRHDVAGTQIELRLVVQEQLSLRQRGMQFLQQLQPVSVLVELRLVNGERSAAMLGAIHRGVGALQQLGAVRRVARSQRDTDAPAETGRHAAELERLAERIAQALGHARRVGRIGVQ